MKAFIGITDSKWFTFLSGLNGIDEVNFWQPGGNKLFGAVRPGEPFLFKLHSPEDFIVGGGFFAHSSILPLSLAWRAFEQKNGADSQSNMRRRIGKYRQVKDSQNEDYAIGCILLEQPFFFPRSQWINAPSDWSRNIVSGKVYDLAVGEGRRIWGAVLDRLQTGSEQGAFVLNEGVVGRRYGNPVLVTPRLGQGSFRIMVTDAYGRRCAVTKERTLPALEAVHIRPYGEDGPHDVCNGVLLRSDIHKLFDAGYVTLSTEHNFKVSQRIRQEFENGRDYYALHGRQIILPVDKKFWPEKEFIRWHNENVFRD